MRACSDRSQLLHFTSYAIDSLSVLRFDISLPLRRKRNATEPQATFRMISFRRKCKDTALTSGGEEDLIAARTKNALGPLS